MVNQQTISGNWNELKGKLREQWGELSDDELDQVHGNAEQLIGLLQRKTGNSREEIENRLDHLLGNESWYQATKHRLGDFGHAAAGAARGGAAYTANSLRSGYGQSALMVREHPAGSLATCFAAGIVIGVIAALVLQSDD